MEAGRSIRLTAVAAAAVFAFGVVPPANAVRSGAFAFGMTMVWPDVPCAGAACQVTSLSGRAIGAVVGTAPNGAAACAPGCHLSEGPAGLIYDEPPCAAGQSLNGSATGHVQINGGISVGTPQTPMVVNISWIRLGVSTIITFSGGQLGVALAVFRSVSGFDCNTGNGPATVQLIGTGWIYDG